MVLGRFSYFPSMVLEHLFLMFLAIEKVLLYE